MFFRLIFITALLPGHNPMMRRGSDMAGRDKKIAIDKIMIYVSSNAEWPKAPYLYVGCALSLSQNWKSICTLAGQPKPHGFSL